MILSKLDYQSMISNRVDRIRVVIWNQGNGIPFGQNAANAYPDYLGGPIETVPDFGRVRQLVAEILELTTEFETSLSPL